MKFLWVLVGSLMLIVMGLYLMPSKTSAPVTPYMDFDFGSKIVYTTDLQTPKEALIEHCDLRGGVFNECGSICEPDVFTCASVCAYTCEGIGG
ncbi:MAG: hypothetical protein COT88_01555 [Candidatus Colwellbacteria bacterium CG10_big_fil_rev_8_21_14_0_10_41_28]|uniref:Uncharacterized protein n=1 Tax=Candidatus Colwellbacteria bacterium CG10_big_fil_rev_8_21_14_0_10_41_28 TaxID=1974539 RepID=A0A2H0VHA6_9BACT|nr:MAG: hypothetical protein COT88_01555 [Candidatus Colwellbacteria bacterium CG10_big_fil_rev_8_21_14_0_10_41_28]